VVCPTGSGAPFSPGARPLRPTPGSGLGSKAAPPFRTLPFLLLAFLSGACGVQDPGEGGIRDERDLAAIEAMLHGFSRAYVTGDYGEAARRFSSRVVAACGGEAGMEEALSRTHGERRVDYAFYDEVVPWQDDPRRADVIVVERWNGNQADMPMGLEFVREGEGWYLDGLLLPEGLSAHCDPLPAPS
jgi:hypothetical protein